MRGDGGGRDGAGQSRAAWVESLSSSSGPRGRAQSQASGRAGGAQRALLPCKPSLGQSSQPDCATRASSSSVRARAERNPKETRCLPATPEDRAAGGDPCVGKDAKKDARKDAKLRARRRPGRPGRALTHHVVHVEHHQLIRPHPPARGGRLVLQAAPCPAALYRARAGPYAHTPARGGPGGCIGEPPATRASQPTDRAGPVAARSGSGSSPRRRTRGGRRGLGGWGRAPEPRGAGPAAPRDLKWRSLGPQRLHFPACNAAGASHSRFPAQTAVFKASG